MEYHEALDPLRMTVLTVPAAEVLHDPGLAYEAWPTESATDPSFLEQIRQRKELADHLDDILENLKDPTMSLEAATNQGLLKEVHVEKLYRQLSNLLADGDYARAVLYLPFEFLPRSSWVPHDENLQDAIELFRTSYLSAWYNLLEVQDVRANFVDGDVLETHLRTGDLPRVVKAAHLVPKLVEYGMIGTSEVITLLKDTDDPVLKNDFTDSLVVLDGMGLIANGELQLMKSSEDETVRNTAQIIEREREKAAPPKVAATLDDIRTGVEAAIASQDIASEDGITERRAWWLAQKRREEAIALLADQVSDVILQDILPKETIINLLTPENSDLYSQVLIEGIRKAIESIAQTGRQDPGVIYQDFNQVLLSLWDRNDTSIRASLEKTYRRLYRLGIVEKDQLVDLGITVPFLGGPISENLTFIPDEVERLKLITSLMESDPELTSLAYPIVTVGGSRLKGYGEQTSDLDIGVFVKPDVPFAQKEAFRDKLGAKLKSAGYYDEALEFWLEEDNDHLSVRDSPDNDMHVADSYWTHVLFGTAWIGNNEAIHALRQKLLPAYFYETDESTYGRSARNLYLERLEQDLLQYRLMHKGYERHYPSRNTLKDVPHTDVIDGHSVFWDPGYRQLATKLFIHMVFLPKVATPET